MTEASAAVVRPTAGVVRSRVRGLRCDAKAGISFRGPPTGLGMGSPQAVQALGEGSGGTEGCPTVHGAGPIHPGAAYGSPVPVSREEGRIRRRRPRGVVRLGGETGHLTEHASQSVVPL
ncbi:hypothetical protein GCM10020227_44970 [Streptomyces flavovirens]